LLSILPSTHMSFLLVSLFMPFQWGKTLYWIHYPHWSMLSFIIHSFLENKPLSIYIFFGLTPTPCHWSWCPFMATCHLNFFLITLPCHAIPLGAPYCSHHPPSFFIVSLLFPIIPSW
jgi:hypothetical protein